MEKELRSIKDYLHLYLGSPCIIGDRNWKPQNIAPEDRAPYTDPEYGKPITTTIRLHGIEQFSHKMTPILRPFSDMKDDELDRLTDLTIKSDYKTTFEKQAEITRYLLSKYFDLFNLIPDGLALSSTELQTK